MPRFNLKKKGFTVVMASWVFCPFLQRSLLWPGFPQLPALWALLLAMKTFLCQKNCSITLSVFGFSSYTSPQLNDSFSEWAFSFFEKAAFSQKIPFTIITNFLKTLFRNYGRMVIDVCFSSLTEKIMRMSEPFVSRQGLQTWIKKLSWIFS